MDKLGYRINRPSNLVIVTAGGQRIKALGEIENFPINVNYLKIPTTIQVLESRDDVLILGNDWLHKVKSSLDWHTQILTIRYKGRTEKISITCVTDDDVARPDDSYNEYSEEDKY